MNTSYLTTFEFQHAPFCKEVSDADLWVPASKQSIVDELLQALDARESVVLTGEPGVGKTCVLRALRHRLPQAGFRLTYCHNATLGRRDFYRQLCIALGLSPSATAAAVFYAVSTHVEELGRERVHPVFLFDEAHLLKQDMLEHLHILLNYEWDSRALLSLVLVGLPELRSRLELRTNRSLYSRLTHRLVIDSAKPQDTVEYIRYRFERAGCHNEILTSDAIAMLHEAASGSLRDIDRIATAALQLAHKRNKKLVERDTLAAVLHVEGNDS